LRWRYIAYDKKLLEVSSMTLFLSHFLSHCACEPLLLPLLHIFSRFFEYAFIKVYKFWFLSKLKSIVIWDRRIIYKERIFFSHYHVFACGGT
jgi:hypothetical protein